MAVLSLLLAGLGQMVLGQVAKGVVVLLGTVVLSVLTDGVAAPLLLAVGACDAFVIAKKLKEGRAVGYWDFF
jgi:TM2 domain-containing membrane protein YozV